MSCSFSFVGVHVVRYNPYNHNAHGKMGPKKGGTVTLGLPQVRLLLMS